MSLVHRPVNRMARRPRSCRCWVGTARWLEPAPRHPIYTPPPAY